MGHWRREGVGMVLQTSAPMDKESFRTVTARLISVTETGFNTKYVTEIKTRRELFFVCVCVLKPLMNMAGIEWENRREG